MKNIIKWNNKKMKKKRRRIVDFHRHIIIFFFLLLLLLLLFSCISNALNKRNGKIITIQCTQVRQQHIHTYTYTYTRVRVISKTFLTRTRTTKILISDKENKRPIKKNFKFFIRINIYSTRLWYFYKQLFQIFSQIG